MIRGSAEKPTMGTQPVVDVDVVIVVDVEVSSSRIHRSDTTDCILLLLLLALPLLFLLSEKAHYKGSAGWQDGKKGRQLALLIDSKSPLSVCAFG